MPTSQDQTRVIGGHDMILYLAPYAASTVAPSTGIPWGTPWGAPWVDRGYTRDGLHFNMQVTRTEVRVDQVVDPVLRIPTARDLRMASQMAQITADNVYQATGQGTAPSIIAQQTAGNDDLQISAQIVDRYESVGFDVRNPADVQAVRVIGYHGLPQGQTNLNFVFNDAATIQFEFALIPDSAVLWGNAPNQYPRIVEFMDIYAPLGGA